MHPVLNASNMCSSQGLGRTSNPRITEAKTIDPPRYTGVIPIMTLVVPTIVPGGGDRMTPPTYSPTQVKSQHTLQPTPDPSHTR
jgi:hypothetical protein